jgi:prepilin-type N-terminal cleavage/methylation domain-containing protein
MRQIIRPFWVSHGRRQSRRGFTLIEAMLTLVIVGVGFFSMLGLYAACSTQNRVSGNMTTAMLLANNVQEAMANATFNDPLSGKVVFGPEASETLATFDDVDDFDGQNFTPPIDSMRQQIPELEKYSQAVTVVPVYPNRLSSNSDPDAPEIADSTYTGAVRITVVVIYTGRPETAYEAYRMSWIKMND